MLSTYLCKQRSVNLYLTEATEGLEPTKKNNITMVIVLLSELLCIP